MPDQNSFLRTVFRRHDVQIGCIVVLMIIFSALSSTFLSATNVVGLLENYSVTAIMASGLLVVLISGGIDIPLPPLRPSANTWWRPFWCA